MNHNYKKIDEAMNKIADVIADGGEIYEVLNKIGNIVNQAYSDGVEDGYKVK